MDLVTKINQKILLITLLILLLGSLGLNAFLFLRDSNDPTDQPESSDNQNQIEKVLIDTRNLEAIARTSCDIGENRSYLYEKDGDLFIHSSSRQEDIRVNQGDLLSDPDDFENGWQFTKSTYIFNDCRFILTTRTYNFTTGGGQREDSWLYDREKDTFTQLEGLIYSFSSISQDGMSVLLWQDWFNAEESDQQFAWLRKDGNFDRFNIDTSELSDWTIESTELTGQSPLVTNSEGVILYLIEWDKDRSYKQSAYYYYEDDQIQQIAVIPDDVYPTGRYFDEESKTILLFQLNADIKTPTRLWCGPIKCGYELIGEYKIN